MNATGPLIFEFSVLKIMMAFALLILNNNLFSTPQDNLAAVANAASLCFFGLFSRKSSIIQKVLVRLI